MNKILFLNTNIGYGGASKMMVWVANTLAEHNYDVTFLTYRDDNIQQPLSKKVKFVFLPLEDATARKINLLHTVIEIRRFVKKHKFELAVGFLTPSQLRLSLACIGLDIKLIFSQRGDPFQNNKNQSLKSVLSRLSFTKADYFVFQTEGARSYYSKRVQNSSVIIPNPVVPLVRTSTRMGNIESRIVNVARLDIKQKRQDLLIEAFNKISRQFPEFVLELYGDGPDKEKLGQLAASNSNIRFMGKTTDVVTALQNATCTVLSSDFEGVPNALLESMSLGVPSISTDCSPGGAAMLIKNGYNGLLIPRGNAELLAEAISYVILNQAEAEKMGLNSQNVKNIYSEQKIAEKWVELFDNILKK